MAKNRNLEAERDPMGARQSTDPSDRSNRPFLLAGDYPARDQQREIFPGVYDDAHVAEQHARIDALEAEGGPLRGSWPGYPDRGMAESPEMMQARAEEEARLRAYHGGLSDDQGEAQAVPGGKPFTL